MIPKLGQTLSTQCKASLRGIASQQGKLKQGLERLAQQVRSNHRRLLQPERHWLSQRRRHHYRNNELGS